MTDYARLHHFHSTTRPKGLLTRDKVLRTIFTFQVENERAATTADVIRRCHYFASRAIVKMELQDLLLRGHIDCEQTVKRGGRPFSYWVEYEGFRRLEQIMKDYEEENAQ